MLQKNKMQNSCTFFSQRPFKIEIVKEFIRIFLRMSLEKFKPPLYELLLMRSRACTYSESIEHDRIPWI